MDKVKLKTFWAGYKRGFTAPVSFEVSTLELPAFKSVTIHQFSQRPESTEASIGGHWKRVGESIATAMDAYGRTARPVDQARGEKRSGRRVAGRIGTKQAA